MREEVRRLAVLGQQNIGGIAGVAAAVETASDPYDQCAAPIKVQKTVKRAMATMKHGMFRTQEIVRVCAARCTHTSGELVTRRSEALQQLVPAGANYGYDLEVFAGLERFVHHRQREEIRNTFQTEYGISLSSGEVSVLTGTP